MKTYLQEFPPQNSWHLCSYVFSRGIEILELNGIDVVEWNKY